MEYKSFAFTIRPKNGLTDKLESRIIQWLKKQDYAFAVTEMSAEAKHLHGQIFCECPRAKGAVQLSLERIQESVDPDWCPASKKVLRRGVKIAYNSQFIEEYLNKDDSTVIFNNPPDEEEGYYPSEEEQQKVKDTANAVDKRLHSIYTLYQEWFSNNKGMLENIPLREQRIAMFLYDAWYVSKTLPTQNNIKYEKELARRVRHYIYPQTEGYKELIPEKKIQYINNNFKVTIKE